MTNKEIEREFKEIEKKLIKLLKSASLNISDGDDSEQTKALIKSHIEKVNEAKGLFERYEVLAKKLQNFDDDDDTQTLEKPEEMIAAQNKDGKTEKPVNAESKAKNIKKKTMMKVEKEKTF